MRTYRKEAEIDFNFRQREDPHVERSGTNTGGVAVGSVVFGR
jgi:hypothetical protein